MYSTCLFCHANLGANEAIEHFPIGRRLAFDAAKGRLWVVCRKCERWNLTPLEERWEAIEECERAFSETRLRVSTDNIGLARVKEGLELVRIGMPLRPEMAAWRYGDQFGRRRRRYLMLTGAGVAVGAGLAITGVATGYIVLGSSVLTSAFNTMNGMKTIVRVIRSRRTQAHVQLPGHAELTKLHASEVNRAAIVRANDVTGEWGLQLTFEESIRRMFRRLPFEDKWYASNSNGKSSYRTILRKRELKTILTGADAIRAAGQLLPAINSTGAKRKEIDSAVRLIGEVDEPSRLFQRYLPGSIARKAGEHTIANMPKEIRLALEMASHEDAERRALEGELELLESAWRQAEEIAAIADDMFVPEDARERLEDMKGDKAGVPPLTQR